MCQPCIYSGYSAVRILAAAHAISNPATSGRNSATNKQIAVPPKLVASTQKEIEVKNPLEFVVAPSIPSSEPEPQHPELMQRLQEAIETNAELSTRLKKTVESGRALEEALQQERAGHAESERAHLQAQHRLELYMTE